MNGHARYHLLGSVVGELADALEVAAGRLLKEFPPPDPALADVGLDDGLDDGEYARREVVRLARAAADFGSRVGHCGAEFFDPVLLAAIPPHTPVADALRAVARAVEPLGLSPEEMFGEWPEPPPHPPWPAQPPP